MKLNELNAAPTNNSAAEARNIVAEAASKSPSRADNNNIDRISMEESTATAVAASFADADATLEDASALANDALEETMVAAIVNDFESLTTAAANSLVVADATLEPP